MDLLITIKHYLKSLFGIPLSAEQFCYRGIRKMSKSDYDGALEDFNLSIAKNQSYSRAYFNRSLVHFNLKQIDKAVVDVHRALWEDSSNVNAYLLSAAFNKMLDMPDLELKDYKKAAELGSEEAIQWLANNEITE